MKTTLTLILALIVAQLASAIEVTFSWSDNSSNESGFEMEYQNSAGEWRTVATIPADTTEWTDINHPADNTAVAARLRAVNAFGASGYSNVVDTSAPDGTPSDAGVKSTSVQVTEKSEKTTLTVTYYDPAK